MTTVYILGKSAQSFNLTPFLREIHDGKVKVSKLEHDFTTQTLGTNGLLTIIVKEIKELKIQVSTLEHDLKVVKEEMEHMRECHIKAKKDHLNLQKLTWDYIADGSD